MNETADSDPKIEKEQGGESDGTSRRPNVLIGVTGSVAALKLPLLTQLFNAKRVNVKVVSTEHAFHFFKPEEVAAEILRDEDEWKLWNKRSDPVLHIELRRWADIAVIAPLDANTLAKMAAGICDNLLTNVLRAWNPSRPVVVCPAMNTLMWEHPLTARHLETIKNFGYVQIISPIVKTLVCADTGTGAMEDVHVICATVMQILSESKNLQPGL